MNQLRKSVVLSNSGKLTDQQEVKFMDINQANLLTSGARKRKENFMEIFEKQTKQDASAFFDSWYENVIKSNINSYEESSRDIKEL